MRKIYAYTKDNRSLVEEFIKATNDKIKEKMIFQLVYIRDESNPFCEPYVKHFSMERYRKMYELRIKAAETMIRIIFYEHDGEIVFLHAFHKRDRKDTDRGLESALKILESIVDKNGKIPNVPSQQKWTQKSFKKRNESYSFFCFRKTAAFIPRFA